MLGLVVDERQFGAGPDRGRRLAVEVESCSLVMLAGKPHPWVPVIRINGNPVAFQSGPHDPPTRISRAQHDVDESSHHRRT